MLKIFKFKNTDKALDKIRVGMKITIISISIEEIKIAINEVCVHRNMIIHCRLK